MKHLAIIIGTDKVFCVIVRERSLEIQAESSVSFFPELFRCSKKGKVFPYSLPSVGPGADPGVQAVSPQVT